MWFKHFKRRGKLQTKLTSGKRNKRNSEPGGQIFTQTFTKTPCATNYVPGSHGTQWLSTNYLLRVGSVVDTLLQLSSPLPFSSRYWELTVFVGFVFDFLWPRLWHVEFSGQRLEPAPQQRPKPQRWQCQILNPPHHKGTLRAASFQETVVTSYHSSQKSFPVVELYQKNLNRFLIFQWLLEQRFNHQLKCGLRVPHMEKQPSKC